jgi:hypothetical protein
MSELNPGELANLDQAVAKATSEVNHHVEVYAAILQELDPTDALIGSVTHILGDKHNAEISPTRRAVEMSIAVRMIHDLRTELTILKAGMVAPAPVDLDETRELVAAYVQTYREMARLAGQDAAWEGLTAVLAQHQPGPVVTAMAVRGMYGYAYGERVGP